MNKKLHTPALLQEVVNYLQVKEGEKYIDCTFGFGGHTKEILARGGKVLGLDIDEQVLLVGREAFSSEIAAGQLVLRKANFTQVEELAKEEGFSPVAGILYDLGVNSYQLDTPERGFSFRFKGQPLDMRMDMDLGVKAGDLINMLSENELTRLFTEYGEERYARKIAKAIVESRAIQPITTGDALAESIVSAYPPQDRHGRIHPATRVFQALRIAVNTELDSLQISLPRAVRLLKPSGRLLILAFHSLEDEIAKRLGERPTPFGEVIAVVKKPITPTDEEVSQNPRSRSARLRVYEKI